MAGRASPAADLRSRSRIDVIASYKNLSLECGGFQFLVEGAGSGRSEDETKINSNITINPMLSYSLCYCRGEQEIEKRINGNGERRKK